jgi:hypothetical protein
VSLSTQPTPIHIISVCLTCVIGSVISTYASPAIWNFHARAEKMLSYTTFHFNLRCFSVFTLNYSSFMKHDFMEMSYIIFISYKERVELKLKVQKLVLQQEENYLDYTQHRDLLPCKFSLYSFPIVPIILTTCNDVTEWKAAPWTTWPLITKCPIPESVSVSLVFYFCDAETRGRLPAILTPYPDCRVRNKFVSPDLKVPLSNRTPAIGIGKDRKRLTVKNGTFSISQRDK